MDTMNKMRKCFFVGVNSVQPQKLIENVMTREGDNLKILDKIYPLRDTYIVGFGKAVGGMINPLENILETSKAKSFLKRGIVSVPCGYLKFAESEKISLNRSSKIEIYEGAKSNLPDSDSLNTTKKIVNLVNGLSKEDLLLVLISGGGSALLPLPLHPLTLEEKIVIIKSLSLGGASINELNIVRKAISATKGGKLVKNVRCQVLTFILSDIIDSPLDLVACGPTVPNKDSLDAPYKVLQKYNIEISENLRAALNSRSENKSASQYDHVHNILLGDNVTALKSIFDHILQEDNSKSWIPIIMTSSLQGESSDIGVHLARLAFHILLLKYDTTMNQRDLEQFCEKLNVERIVMESLANKIRESDGSLFLLFGGETTVTVQGKGKGGRNQEMVLAFSLEIEKLSKMHNVDGEITFLSGGTDGIDGPTDAAGAVTYFTRDKGKIQLQTEEGRKQGLIPEKFLEENNSYEYFSKLSQGTYLLRPGHTGTNVMDIQMLCIKKH